MFTAVSRDSADVGGAFAVTHHPSVAEQEGQLIETNPLGTSKTPSYTKSVSWQHHLRGVTEAAMISKHSFVLSGNKNGKTKQEWLYQLRRVHQSIRWKKLFIKQRQFIKQ